MVKEIDFGALYLVEGAFYTETYTQRLRIYRLG